MKKIIFILLAFFIAPALQSQNLSTAPTGEAGLFGAAQGGSPMLNLVLMELRTNAKSRDLGETVGSPYSTENFVKSKIYYGDEPQGDFFIRYNALNSVIEMKKTDLPDEEAKRLYPDKKIKIKYLNKEFSLIENLVGINLSSAQTDLNIQRFKDNKKVVICNI